MPKYDKVLIEKLIRGDERALHGFYKKHKKPLLNFILRYTKDDHDADEVLQDSFFAFIEALRDFRGQSSLKTFLFSIAKRKAIDKIRRKKVRRVLFSRFPEGVIESIATVLMDDEIDRRFLAARIERAFAGLPRDYATILRLKYKEGYKVAEIAHRMQLSFKATESLLFRARRAFVKVYKQL